MKTFHYDVDIEASAQQVWSALTDPEPYRRWTEPFIEGGATITGSWDEGARVSFLWDDGDGRTNGMLAVVDVNRPTEFLSLRYVGLVEKDAEDTTSEAALVVAGAYEKYSLTGSGGTTTLSVDVDMDETYAEWMGAQWPRALKLLKELAEDRS